MNKSIKTFLMLLSISSINWAAEDIKNERKMENDRPNMTQVPKHEGCQTYIPKTMVFKGYDKKRDVALYTEETRIPFWDRFNFFWGPDANK